VRAGDAVHLLLGGAQALVRGGRRLPRSGGLAARGGRAGLGRLAPQAPGGALGRRAARCGGLALGGRERSAQRVALRRR